MSLKGTTLLACALIVGVSLPVLAVDNVLVDPGFEGPPAGDGWGTWGNISFNNFWGADVHASLWADRAGNFGGVYQPSLSGLPEKAYQLVLFNTRIESNWSADLLFGFECFAADDSTKVGETVVLVNTAARVANGQVDANVFTMEGVTAPGTVYVRPLFRFENVNPAYAGQANANGFVFNTFMSLAPSPGQEFLKNAGLEDTNGDGGLGDYWGKWGNADFNAFFGANGHASLFADTIGNTGGVWQQGILGKPGHHYQFDLADVRIEQNWDADLYFGLEYYGDDDFHKLGETIVPVDTSQTGDNLKFSMTGTAVAGTVYVRPTIRFDNVRTDGGSQRSSFVFGAALTEFVPGDLNNDGFVNSADVTSFQGCATGPSVPYSPPDLPSSECALVPDVLGHIVADSDKDGDVDMDDFGVLQRCWSGTEPVALDCAD